MSYLSYHALLSLIPRKRALSISATLLLAVSLGMPARIVHASQPTATTARALENISTTRPCTAAALLHVLRGPDGASSGIFYLPEFPTPFAIALLVGLEHGGEDFQLQPNLYADVSYYIEVRWSLEKLNQQVVMLSAQAQVVNTAGVVLTPVHIVEPLTRVLMVGQSLRLLPSASVE